MSAAPVASSGKSLPVLLWLPLALAAALALIAVVVPQLRPDNLNDLQRIVTRGDLPPSERPFPASHAGRMKTLEGLIREVRDAPPTPERDALVSRGNDFVGTVLRDPKSDEIDRYEAALKGGRLAEVAGNKVAAADWFRKAANYQPNRKGGWFNLAVAEQHRGNIDAARKAAQQARAATVPGTVSDDMIRTLESELGIIPPTPS